jgi:hypothetical protein
MNSNKMDITKACCLAAFTLAVISILFSLEFGYTFTNSAVYAQTNNSSSTLDGSSVQEKALTKSASSIEENIGQPFYVENTKSTSMRVLSVDSLPSVEVSYVGNSTINGSPTQTIGTIVDKMGSEGAVHSKGQAIILTATGQVITYKSESVGYYNPDGSFSDSGIIQFGLPFQGSNNSNNATALSELSDDSFEEFNNVLGIYKKTVDPLGNGFTKVWKWG